MTNQSARPIWAAPFASLQQMFTQAAQAHPDRMYCKLEDTVLSYGEAAAAVAAMADDLGEDAKGRVVALVLPNSPQFLVAYYGALAAGAQPALVNYAHPDATVATLLDGLDVAAVLSDRDIPGLEVTHFDLAAAMEMSTRSAPAPQWDASPDDIGAILFSGGTTGLPKQVPHSQHAMIRMIERIEWGWPTQEGEVWLPVAPFTHVYGILMGVLNPVLRAGSLTIPARFHPDVIVQMLQDEAVTVFGGGPPAIYQAVMSSSQFGGATFPALRVCPGGGAPFPLDVLRRWEEATGLPIHEGYGMTEIAPISVNNLAGGVKPGSAGKPVPDTDIQIVDIATGDTVLPVGEVGEIRVKGPHMMGGYTGNAQETAIALRHGYVYTGDIGVLDEQGFLTIQDRKKDVIFVKGFNVFPRELEETLLSHPAVAGACVVGRSDDRSGEVPVGYVALRSDADVDDLRAHCAVTLAAYKLPAELVVLDALPLTPAGKVDRSALRARAQGAAT